MIVRFYFVLIINHLFLLFRYSLLYTLDTYMFNNHVQSISDDSIKLNLCQINLLIFNVFCDWIVNKTSAQNSLKDFGGVWKVQQMDEQDLS